MTSQLNFNLEKPKCKVAVYHVEAVRILGPNFSKHLRLLSPEQCRVERRVPETIL
jgi:hypothetical protein